MGKPIEFQSQKRIPVAFASDNNYIVGLGVAICSLLMVAPDEAYDIFVIHSAKFHSAFCLKIKSEIKRLSPSSAITFIEAGDDFNNAHKEKWFGISCYYRLLIPWLIPQYSKIFYIDSDVLFQKGLKTLYDTFDLEGFYVAGVNFDSFQDFASPMNSYIKELGLSPKKYINSGVLLINSDLQRQNHLLEQYKNLMKFKYRCPDQDIINIICRDKICHLDPSYNCVPGRNENNKTEERILHYIGRYKPWNSVTWKWEQWTYLYKQTSFYDSGLYRSMIYQRFKIKIKHRLINVYGHIIDSFPYVATCYQFWKKKMSKQEVEA